MSYADYDLNPLQLALDLASFGDGTLGLPHLLDRQEQMFTDHGYPAAADAALEATLRSLGGRLAVALGQSTSRTTSSTRWPSCSRPSRASRT